MLIMRQSLTNCQKKVNQSIAKGDMRNSPIGYIRHKRTCVLIFPFNLTVDSLYCQIAREKINDNALFY